MPKPSPVIPICKESELFLVRHGHGDDERFAAIFRAMWDRIPKEARKLLERFWWSDGHRRCTAFWGPEIELLDDWEGRAKFVAATVLVDKQRIKFRMKFWAPFFTAIPDDSAQIWMAHEMAHVYQFATDTLYTHAPYTREEAIVLLEKEFDAPFAQLKKDYQPDEIEVFLEEIKYSHSKVEKEAEQIIKAWGFDPNALETWRKANIETIFPD